MKDVMRFGSQLFPFLWGEWSVFSSGAPPKKNADSRRIQSPEVVLTFPKYLHIRKKQQLLGKV